MVSLTMRFTLPEQTDWAAIPALMRERAEQLYLGYPGLISKAFLYNEKTRTYGGNYVWESREHVQAFLASAVVRAAVEKFGEPQVNIDEIAVYIQDGAIRQGLVRT